MGRKAVNSYNLSRPFEILVSVALMLETYSSRISVQDGSVIYDISESHESHRLFMHSRDFNIRRFTA